MTGVSISYGDIAVGAKESSVPTASEKAPFVNIEQLKGYNLNFPNYANPCELYQTVLNGAAEVFPTDTSNKNFGLWSDQISGSDGRFATPVVLTLTTSEQYASQGFTLTFDNYNGIYANDINIKWYQGGALLDEKDFTPDNAVYFCREYVSNFDKVVITFKSINMPYNRLKLRSIDYGYGTVFYGDELGNVKIIQEIDPISSQIAINTCDFTLNSKSDIVYSFQRRQPLGIYFEGKLKATTFVKNSKREAQRRWKVESEDYIGLLDRIAFYGGIYKSVRAKGLIEEIHNLSGVPFEMSLEFNNSFVTGYIPFTTCREALMQIAFAIGAVVDTSNSENVKIYKLSDEITQTISKKRTKQGQNFDDEETVTGVEVTEHSYKAVSESTTAYEAEEEGTGNDILVKFAEPLHDLSITNGTITSSGANYAVINANTGCVLSGQKYEHLTSAKRKNNPNVLANDVERILAIENATLVNSANSSAVLARCYDWLVKTMQTNINIIEGKHVSGGDYAIYGQVKYGKAKYGKSPKVVTYDKPVNVGDVINCDTKYLGTLSGRIIKQTFDLNSTTIVKEAILK